MRASLLSLAAAFVAPAASLLAGPSGISAGLLEAPQVEMYNHTLLGERVPASQVVCRNMWGTPMLPDDTLRNPYNTLGYSVISPVNPELIAQSLIIPPLTDGPVYNPMVDQQAAEAAQAARDAATIRAATLENEANAEPPAVSPQ